MPWATRAAVSDFSYAFRFSLDGVHWTACDLDGAGSNPGLNFTVDQLAPMGVNP